MAYTEFYCNASTGDNLNAGTTEGAPDLSNTGGNWVQATRVFTCSGSPDLSGITNSMYASVYADGASAPTGYVAKITAVDNGAKTITLSATILAGSAPSNGTGNRTIQVGGAWKGPTGASPFPIGFVVTALSTATNQNPRVNFKNNASYSITATMSANDAGPLVWQGYSSSVGDGGRATFDASTGTAFTPLDVTGANNDFIDLIFTDDGGGATNLVSCSGSECLFYRCVFTGAASYGVLFSGTGCAAIECEAYACSVSSSTAGFGVSAGSCIFRRCIAHDNLTNFRSGFFFSGASVVVVDSCIAESNVFGIATTNTGSLFIFGCDIYANTSDGISLGNTSAALYVIENCNLIDNGGRGINGSGSGSRNGAVVNCGFGSGTAANTSGATTGLKQMSESGSVTYPTDLTPWVDPANGDFRINLPEAIGTGRGAFTQTASSYAGASSSPVIGACQVADYPAEGDVDNGVDYANGAYTGTLVGGGGGDIFLIEDGDSTMQVTGGATDVTTYFKLRKTADGLEATALTITDLDLQYTRSGATPAAKVDATALAAANSAHGDNQAFEIDGTDQPGVYRVDWPDAAFAAGVKEVVLTVKHSSCFTKELHVLIDAPANLTSVNADQQSAADAKDFFDAGYDPATNKVEGVKLVDTTTTNTDMRGTDNAGTAAELAKVPKSDSNVTWNATALASIQSEANDAIVAYDPPTHAELVSEINAVQSDIAGLNNLSTADIDARLAAIGLDHLISASVTGTDVADNSIVARLVSKSATADWDSFTHTTDSLEAIRDRGDAAWITATGFSTHSATDVWAVGTRRLTDGTNIVLAKGVGVTGFNDLSAAQVNAEVDTALSDVGLTTTVTGRIDAAVSTRATPAQVNAETLDVINVDTLVAGVTVAESLRRIGAITSGEVSGAGTGTETFSDYAESAATIVITVDGSGNRTAVTYN